MELHWILGEFVDTLLILFSVVPGSIMGNYTPDREFIIIKSWTYVELLRLSWQFFTDSTMYYYCSETQHGCRVCC